MVERSRQDSTRDLLEELEDGWATAPPPQVGLASPLGAPAKAAPPSTEARGVAPSDPDLSSLDDGWLDDLFPGGEEEDEEEEDEEEPEPELPDEKLDPEAFALAKKARDERAARKKEKKRAKAEAKRARQKARAAAMRQKQKAKKSRPAAPARREAPTTGKKARRQQARATEPVPADDLAATESPDDSNDDLVVAATPATPARTKASSAVKRAPDTMASVKLLAIVLAILLAVAAAVAAVLK